MYAKQISHELLFWHNSWLTELSNAEQFPRTRTGCLPSPMTIMLNKAPHKRVHRALEAFLMAPSIGVTMAKTSNQRWPRFDFMDIFASNLWYLFCKFSGWNSDLSLDDGSWDEICLQPGDLWSYKSWFHNFDMFQVPYNSQDDVSEPIQCLGKWCWSSHRWIRLDHPTSSSHRVLNEVHIVPLFELSWDQLQRQLRSTIQLQGPDPHFISYHHHIIITSFAFGVCDNFYISQSLAVPIEPLNSHTLIPRERLSNSISGVVSFHFTSLHRSHQ